MSERKNIVVFDIDGTLSIVGDRLKYLQETPPNWDAFYDACGEDACNEPVWAILHCMRQKYSIRWVTGRRESCRKDTLKWMKENLMGCPSPYLFMRAEGDFRHDTEVKPELVADFIDQILLVFEDRTSMVDKWRELGITCCQVANGDF